MKDLRERKISRDQFDTLVEKAADLRWREFHREHLSKSFESLKVRLEKLVKERGIRGTQQNQMRKAMDDIIKAQSQYQ